MNSGFNGKILHVDLTKRQTSIEEPDYAWYRTYMGGSGFATYYSYKLNKAGIDSFDPGNVLIFALSVVTGAPIPGFNRFLVAAKSPLTSYYGESESGGYFGPELKFAGFDALVIVGKAIQPVYLYINNGIAEIRDASNLWGKDNYKSLQHLKNELNDNKIKAAMIGPAGEKLVRFANITDGLEHFCGRLGLGAVMGSKHLKAVVVRGTNRPKFHDKKGLAEVARWMNERTHNYAPTVGLSEGGTPRLVKGLNSYGVMPTKNFKYGNFEDWSKLSWDAYKNEIYDSPGTCYMCSVKCKRRLKSDNSKYPISKNYGGAEYETLSSLGSNLLNSNLKSVAHANQTCNLLGIDTITTGNMIAFAMECYENATLSDDDTDGKPLTWGDSDQICEMVRKIGNRQGFGDILAEGMVKASSILGPDSKRFAFHIKGSDPAMHDGRGKTGMALGMAVSPAGADHQEVAHDTAFQGEGYNALQAVGMIESIEPLVSDEKKAKFVHLAQRVTGINNLLGLCNLCSVPKYAMTFEKLIKAVETITGWQTSLFELMLASERSLVLARLFNIREGLSSEEDDIIERWYEPLEKGPLKGAYIEREEFRKMVKTYYALCNWDEKGKPTDGKVLELGLNWTVELS